MNLLPLLALIASGESQTLEFKASFDKATIESLVAFANAQGDKVLLGVSDSGKINGVTQQVTQQVKELLSVLNGEMSRQNLMDLLGFKDRNSFTINYLKPVLNQGQIEMTHPEKPNSRLQKYRAISEQNPIIPRGGA